MSISISQMIDNMGKWCPSVVVILIIALLFPVRLLVLLCLPRDSSYAWHPLHKTRDFWDFKK